MPRYIQADKDIVEFDDDVSHQEMLSALQHKYGPAIEPTTDIQDALTWEDVGNKIYENITTGLTDFSEALTGMANNPDREAAIRDMFNYIGAGAIKGIKRVPRLYHGTDTEEGMSSIAKEGFLKGESNELNLPGTSLTRDPWVSNRYFTGKNPKNIYEVTPDIPKEQWRNLKPSEYASGVVPEESIYNKPNLFYNEDEVFVRRFPDIEKKIRLEELKEEWQQHSRMLRELNIESRDINKENLTDWNKSYKKELEITRKLELELFQLETNVDKAPPLKIRRVTEEEAEKIRILTEQRLADLKYVGDIQATIPDKLELINRAKGDSAFHTEITSKLVDREFTRGKYTPQKIVRDFEGKIGDAEAQELGLDGEQLWHLKKSLDIDYHRGRDGNLPKDFDERYRKYFKDRDKFLDKLNEVNNRARR